MHHFSQTRKHASLSSKKDSSEFSTSWWKLKTASDPLEFNMEHQTNGVWKVFFLLDTCMIFGSVPCLDLQPQGLASGEEAEDLMSCSSFPHVFQLWIRN